MDASVLDDFTPILCRRSLEYFEKVFMLGGGSFDSCVNGLDEFDD